MYAPSEYITSIWYILFAVSTYVAQKDTREVIDIKKLNAEIKGIFARQNKLRTAIDEIVADLEVSQQ